MKRKTMTTTTATKYKNRLTREVDAKRFPLSFEVFGNEWDVKVVNDLKSEDGVLLAGLCDSGNFTISIDSGVLRTRKTFDATFWHEVEHAILAVFMAMNQDKLTGMAIGDLQELLAELHGIAMSNVLRTLPKWVINGT